MQKYSISFTSAVLMNINLMIGAGIFIGPMIMAQHAGNASFLGWPLAGLIFLPIVWSIAYVARLLPGEGSFYTYSNEGIGRFAGFVSGWFYFLGWISIGALQLIGLIEVLKNQFNWGFAIHHPFLFILLFLAFLSAINLGPINIVAKIQSSATFFKLIPIFIALSVFAFYWDPSLPVMHDTTFSSLSLTIPVAIFGFWGFESCCNISNYIEGDKKNASRAVLLGFFITLAIYTLFHASIIYIMGVDALKTEGVAAFISYLSINNPMIYWLLTRLTFASICVTYISGIYGGFIANSSLLYAMSREKLLFMSDYLQKTNSQRRPFFCILFHASLLLFFTLIVNNKPILNAMSNWGLLIAFFLTFVSLLRLQLRKAMYPQSIITFFGFIGVGILYYYSWQLAGETDMMRCMNMLPLFIIATLGMAMYFVNQKLVGNKQ